MTDDELDQALVRLACTERKGLRFFLEHLIEFDRRNAAEKRAYPSLFMYCRGRLRLSEGESYRRIHVARLARRYSLVLDRVETGDVTLSVISVIAPHMNASNSKELLDAAAGMSKREAEFLVARLAPKASPRDFVRVLPAASTAALDLTGALATNFIPSTPSEPIISQSAPQDRFEPLSEESVRIAFTAAKRVFEKLERAKALLRHKFPKGTVANIIEAALDSLLDKRDPERKLRSAKIRQVVPGRRRISQGVKDFVWKRDSGRCSYTSEGGKRCDQTSWLEFDHIMPFALGGRSDEVANIRLLCRAHNQLLARERFS